MGDFPAGSAYDLRSYFVAVNIEMDSADKVWYLYWMVWVYSLITFFFIRRYLKAIIIPVEKTWTTACVSRTVLLRDIPSV